MQQQSQIQDEKTPEENSKTYYMIIGFTQQGKSSLVRYFTGDENIKLGNSNQSCTTSYTSYTIQYKPLGIGSNIVDTQGFGHTQGGDENNNLTILSNIKSHIVQECFETGSQLKAIFVTISLDKTEQLQQILRNIEAMFNNQYQDNIIFFITLGGMKKFNKWTQEKKYQSLEKIRKIVIQKGITFRYVEFNPEYYSDRSKEWIQPTKEAEQIQSQKLIKNLSQINTYFSFEKEYQIIQKIKNEKRAEKQRLENQHCQIWSKLCKNYNKVLQKYEYKQHIKYLDYNFVIKYDELQLYESGIEDFLNADLKLDQFFIEYNKIIKKAIFEYANANNC